MTADLGAGMRRQAQKPWKRKSADQRNRRKGDAEVKRGQCVFAGAAQEKRGLQSDTAEGNAQTKSHLLLDVHQHGRCAALNTLRSCLMACGPFGVQTTLAAGE